MDTELKIRGSIANGKMDKNGDPIPSIIKWELVCTATVLGSKNKIKHSVITKLTSESK